MLDLQKLPTKGNYTIIILLKASSRIKTYSDCQIQLQNGYYAYTGSALGDGSVSLRGRVARHFKKTKKKRWHIDYLLAHKKAHIMATLAASSNDNRECEINSLLKSIEGATVPAMGFGASDCRHKCGSHLLYLGRNPRVDEVAEVYKRLFGDACLQFYSP